MPIPTFTGLPPNPEFKDIVNKFNKLTAEMQNLFLSLDSLNVISLTADHIDAGTLDAGVVTIRGEDGTVFYQIDSTGIVANNGTINTLEFDLATGLLTLMSMLIKSASGFPRVELNSTDNLIAAYAGADQYVKINPLDGTTGTPAIIFRDGAIPLTGFIFVDDISNEFAITANQDIQISAGASDLRLSGALVRVVNWSNFYSDGAARTLQAELDLKADKSAITETVYVAATSGGATTKAITFTNGVRTA